jgi:hypothetical protein
MDSDMCTDAGRSPSAFDAVNGQCAVLLVMLRQAQKPLNASGKGTLHFYIGFVLPSSQEGEIEQVSRCGPSRR